MHDIKTGKTQNINLSSLLLSLSEAVDLADPAIYRHHQRTAYIAWEICTAGDIPDEKTKNIFIASLLHDIGAITIEEKLALQKFEIVDIQQHCLRGQFLLKRIPEFHDIATIIRHHHREWHEWQGASGPDLSTESQIILLADHVERLINRDQYILHQKRNIIAAVTALPDSYVQPRIKKYFFECARRDEFWLDLNSPRLYSLLYYRGPQINITIDYSKLEDISKLFRDIIDFKSPYTATHTAGVAICADLIAQLFGFDPAETRKLRIASNFHDLGKLVIPNAILEKPEPLTEAEFDIIKCHTYYSHFIINSIPGLQEIAECAAYHHEKLNGNGYPFNRTASEIPTSARILAAADIFTALSEDRPYRKGMEKEEIVGILRELQIDKSLDTDAVAVLNDHFEHISAHVQLIQESAKEYYYTRLRLFLLNQ